MKFALQQATALNGAYDQTLVKVLDRPSTVPGSGSVSPVSVVAEPRNQYAASITHQMSVLSPMYLDYLLLVSLSCLCSATNNQCIAPAVHESRHPLRQIEAGRPLQLMAAAQTRSPCHATRPARGTGLFITNFKTIRRITIALVAYLACWETSTEGCYTSDTSSQLPTRLAWWLPLVFRWLPRRGPQSSHR